MASYSKFKKKLIKQKLQQKTIQKMVNESMNDGSLLEYVKGEVIESAGLTNDTEEVVEAEFTEIV